MFPAPTDDIPPTQYILSPTLGSSPYPPYTPALSQTPPPQADTPSPARAILDHQEPSLRAALTPADSRATVIAGVFFSVSAAVSGVGLWFTSRTCVLGHTNIGNIWINFYPLSWNLGAEAMSSQCQGPVSLAGISLPLGSLLLLVCAMVCWLGHRCIVTAGTIVASLLTVATAAFDYFLIKSFLTNNWTAASSWSAREWQIAIITTLATAVLPLIITLLLIPIVRTRSATTRRRLTDVQIFVMLAAAIANPAAGGLSGTPFHILVINLIAWNAATVVLYLALLSLSQAAKSHLDESPVR